MIDASYYTVTYRQLEAILNRYGLRFDNPKGNYIDIVRDVKQTHGLLWKRTQVVKEKVHHIGYPSMTKEVDVRTLKGVLKATGLTPENGYDSQVVFKGAEPLEAFIDRYSSTLRRLKDK